jgi:putative acetyltransferase
MTGKAGSMLIRKESEADWTAISDVHRRAFDAEAEPRLVEALRTAGRLSVSLVAVLGDVVAGHIAFSDVTIDIPGRPLVGLGLAPVGVLPGMQRQGIGSALIRAGLDQCKERRAPFVVVLGDPGYYRRFGFKTAADWGVGNEYGAHEEFMAFEFSPGAIPSPAGIARYSPEFLLVS